MVTSRRRALMAAVSQKSSDNPWGDLPPESTEFGFPLYLNLTEYDAMSDEWYRTEDSISTDLYEWCEQNFVEQEDDGTSILGYVPLTADTKIYINGGLIEEIYKDSGNYWMTGSKLPFEEVYIDNGGYMAGYGAKLPSSGDGNFGELPPESTEFAFPLYLNITELSYDYGYELEYIREVDEILDLLKEWFLDNCIKLGSLGYELELTENNQIYINGSPITRLSKPEHGNEIQFDPAPSPFNSVFLEEDGLYGLITK